MTAAYESALVFPSAVRASCFNAAMAVTYLAFRQGIAPDQYWCGRTLAEDLRWTRTAIARVAGSQ